MRVELKDGVRTVEIRGRAKLILYLLDNGKGGKAEIFTTCEVLED